MSLLWQWSYEVLGRTGQGIFCVGFHTFQGLVELPVAAAGRPDGLVVLRGSLRRLRRRGRREMRRRRRFATVSGAGSFEPPEELGPAGVASRRDAWLGRARAGAPRRLRLGRGRGGAHAYARAAR
uniref:Uncharacterized protein n=1 Tax=Arundo donax TaxID=35708 RepID=A0A0A9GLN2_ARUDO